MSKAIKHQDDGIYPMDTSSEPQSTAEVTSKKPPAPSPASCDYTKTKLYACFDLGFKALSAFALVALGLAGWQLQRNSQLEQLRTQTLERQERRYLPMLRSISIFEIEAKRISEVLRTGIGRPESRSVNEYYGDLEFLAQSIFLPDGDPKVRVLREKGQEVMLPLRAAALMTSEFIEICDRLKGNGIQDSQWTLHSNEILVKYKVSEFSDESEVYRKRLSDGSIMAYRRAKVETREHRETLSDDSIEAWRSWLGTEGMKLWRSDLEALGFYLLYQLHWLCPSNSRDASKSS